MNTQLNINEILQPPNVPELYGIPLEMPGGERESWEFDLKHWTLREKYTAQCMWAFVSWRWVIPFAKWIGRRSVLEVMSGAGHLAYALRMCGTDVIATDNGSWRLKQDFKQLTTIERLRAVKAIEKYGKNVQLLIMSWPPYDTKDAYHALRHLHRVNPAALIVYIGERGGCTADEQFEKHFEDVREDGFEAVRKCYQRWPGIRDSLWLGRYSKKQV